MGLVHELAVTPTAPEPGNPASRGRGRKPQESLTNGETNSREKVYRAPPTGSVLGFVNTRRYNYLLQC